MSTRYTLEEEDVLMQGRIWVLRFDGQYLCGNVDKAKCEGFQARHAANPMNNNAQMAVQRVCKIDKVAISMQFSLANFLNLQIKTGSFSVPAAIIGDLVPVSLEYLVNDLKSWYGDDFPVTDRKAAIYELVKVAVHCIMFDQDPKLVEDRVLWHGLF